MEGKPGDQQSPSAAIHLATRRDIEPETAYRGHRIPLVVPVRRPVWSYRPPTSAAIDAVPHPTTDATLKIGRYMATMMKPMLPPRNTISNGSSIEVNAFTAASTSSS